MKKILHEGQESCINEQCLHDFFAKLGQFPIAAKIDGNLVDLRMNTIDLIDGCHVEEVYVDSKDGIEILRHDTAHILAQALKEIYKDDVNIAIGPVIENGFFYDISLSKNVKNADLVEDIEKIENKMKEIVKSNYPIKMETWTTDKAIAFFEKSGERFKVEIIKDLVNSGVSNVSIYFQDNFVDLCKGPHGMYTGIEKYFKLTHISGSYWRGDSKNEQLQRIYGTCWSTEADLQKYLHMVERAKEIDHRILGKKLDLFHMQQESPGCVFWHKNGWTLYKKIENYMRNKIRDSYDEVHTPQIIDRKLWEMSGHWDHFKENMFCFESENGSFAIKPMNCPAHAQIFKANIRSYKDLPMRLFEFGCCHRNEPSGSLHGIMRVKQFVQDDAHIFCTEDQIVEETKKFCSLLTEVYSDFGFENVVVKFSTRPAKRAGEDELWNKMEQLLFDGAKSSGLDLILNPGEGAFYGPKLEFVLRDAIGRDWQCGTLQLDFVMPQRLDVKYVTDNNSHAYPVMLHRAILGSLQRFIGILIENYEAWFPFWLAPTQVVVVPISSSNQMAEYAKEIAKQLNNKGLIAEVDDRSETLNYRINDLISNKKIPCIMIVGKKEAETGSVSMRVRSSTSIMGLSDAICILEKYNVPRVDFYNDFMQVSEGYNKNL